MWLLHYITNRSLETPAAVKGALSTGEAGGAAVTSFEEHKELEFCSPYGFVSAAPEGECAVVLPLRQKIIRMSSSTASRLLFIFL